MNVKTSLVPGRPGRNGISQKNLCRILNLFFKRISSHKKA